MKIISGTSNLSLAEKIADHLRPICKEDHYKAFISEKVRREVVAERVKLSPGYADARKFELGKI